MANENEAAKKMAKQIEFYLSDANLRTDKFLLQSLKEEWVTLELLLSFNRMRQLAKNPEDIIDAIPLLKTLEVDDVEKPTKFKRKQKFVELSQELIDAKTLVYSGFPKHSQLDELLEFFSDKNVLQVRMQKRQRAFNGECLVEFNTVEDIVKELEYNNESLVAMSFADWVKNGKSSKISAEKKDKKDKKKRVAEVVEVETKKVKVQE
jgi:hypothetical protein